MPSSTLREAVGLIGVVFAMLATLALGVLVWDPPMRTGYGYGAAFTGYLWALAAMLTYRANPRWLRN